MKRIDLEHLVRAAAAITGEDQLIVVGSQAILGSHPNAPDQLLESYEADLVPVNDPKNADLIDGSIGEESPFHKTFGYYAHGVTIGVAVLPDGWRDRVVEVTNANTGGATALCLEVHDLAVSKLAAGREKDLAFVRGLLNHGMASADTVRARVEASSLESELKTLITGRLRRVEAPEP